MSSDRLLFALETGGLALPQSGTLALWRASGDMALSGLDAGRCEVIHSFAPDYDSWARRGMAVSVSPKGPYAASIVFLPRARDLAETMIAEAEAATPDGLIVINGAKTDGIESIAKALKKRVALDGVVSKAHGKCLWFRAQGAFSDWVRPVMSANTQGDMTAPGIFSADAADPASVALAAALPETLKGQIADLGAGWGWLSREILSKDGVTALHLVEAEAHALDCARQNVTDPRAQFHWADATTWKSPSKALDGVIMNPPFHQGRKADPRIGQAFVTAAARLLAPNGQLWMVANRHLPYETTLAANFRDVAEIAGNNRFKILHAARPSRPKR